VSGLPVRRTWRPRQVLAIVGLNAAEYHAAEYQAGVTPTLGKNLLLPGGSGTTGITRPARVAPPYPNSMITGAGPAAFAGTVSESWMSTMICGYEELST
jgi:hypothetical protein